MRRPILLLLLVLTTSAHAAGWQRYTPDGLPPMVQTALPRQMPTLVQAQHLDSPSLDSARPLIEALIQSWVGPEAKWYVHLTQGSSEALVRSTSGVKALALRVTGTAPVEVLAFQLTLRSPLVPDRSFTAVPTPEPFWTRALPVEPSVFSTTPCPPGLSLGSTGLTVTTPANFPLPGGKQLVQELHCAGLDVVYRGGGTYHLADQVTIRAPTWQQAWAVVAPSSLVSLITPGSFDVVNGQATVRRSSTYGTFWPDDVIAVHTSTGLQPVLFQKRLTPWTLLQGENRFYLSLLGSAWEYVSINTQTGVVVLLRQQAMPTRS
ncbi:hypothetical protein [Deinococcus sonorensis]|uniref:Uncharacterized protein n=1 Tax=Deinococcus sonorensis TaxID=309891 RepID=A0ABV8Y854_9DEIO